MKKILPTFLLITLFISCLLLVTVNNAWTDLYSYFREGIKAYECKKYNQAIGNFKKALQIDPTYLRARKMIEKTEEAIVSQEAINFVRGCQIYEGLLEEGWPGKREIIAKVIKEDTDSDGEYEIIVALQPRGDLGCALVLDWNGSKYIKYTINDFESGYYDLIVEDINKDGNKEIITSWKGGSGGFLDVDVFIWKDKKYELIWRAESLYHGRYRIKDIDGDGIKEIITERSAFEKSLFLECNAGPHLDYADTYKWEKQTYILQNTKLVLTPFSTLNSFLEALRKKKFEKAYQLTCPKTFLKDQSDKSIKSFEKIIKTSTPELLIKSKRIRFSLDGGTLQWLVGEKENMGTLIFTQHNNAKKASFFAKLVKIDNAWKISYISRMEVKGK